MNPAKSELMEAGEPAATPMRIWNDHDIDHYITTGFRTLDQYDPDAVEAHRRKHRHRQAGAERWPPETEPPRNAATHHNPGSDRPTRQPAIRSEEQPRPATSAPPPTPPPSSGTDMGVLGSLAVPDRCQVRQTVAHRVARAWHAYSLIRPHLAQRGIPLHLLLRLLDTVATPTLLLGLTTVTLPRLQRRALTAVQRTMVKRTAHHLRRPRETAEAFYRRRERLTENAIVTHMRATGEMSNDTDILLLQDMLRDWKRRG